MKCPICGDPTLAATRPFCSNRCKDVDLAHWLNGSYRVVAEDENDNTDGLDEESQDRPH